MRLVAACLAAAACGGMQAREPAPGPCIGYATVEVIDENGQPVGGARVHVVQTSMRGGPSGLPEARVPHEDALPPQRTDVNGRANACAMRVARHFEHVRASWIVVEHRDWPVTEQPLEASRRVVIGPARTVKVTSSCSEAHIHATAVGTREARTIPAGQGKLQLGPRRYVVRSDGCGRSFARVLDARRSPRLAMDRDSAMLEHPDLAGATVTIRRFRDLAAFSTATLDANGEAEVDVPAGTSCVVLQRADRCEVSFITPGAIWRPELYTDRAGFIARDCAPCPPPSPNATNDQERVGP